MFADLRMWEFAKKWALTSSSIDLNELIRLQATWAEETSDWKGAVDMWLAANEPVRAVSIYGDRGWLDELIELCRSMDKYTIDPL